MDAEKKTEFGDRQPSYVLTSPTIITTTFSSSSLSPSPSPYLSLLLSPPPNALPLLLNASWIHPSLLVIIIEEIMHLA